MPGQFIARLLGLPAYRDKTTAFVLTAQQTIYRAIIVLLTVTAILWMAVFLYVAFYYSYMPAISHTRPVHLQFESCGREPGLCTFPTANVTLTRRQQLLMVGQPYRVVVELDMPESRRNQDVGMFMVCLELKDADKIVLDKSCRSAMLHYKSPLLQYIITTSLAPFFMSGSAEEKQMVTVELFSGFEEDPMRPVTEATVQIRSQHVDVYKVALRIHAHFTGLRYFMFHWPVVSALLGIMTNLFFLSVIAFLSWYKFFTPKQVVVHLGYDSSAAKTLEERRAMAKERLMRERSKLVTPRTSDVKEEPSSSKEGIQEPASSTTSPPPAQQSHSHKGKGTRSKEELEKPAEVERSVSPVEKKSDGEESGRTSEEYEVIQPGASQPNDTTVKSENTEDELDNDEDLEDFSEIGDTDGNEKSSKDDLEAQEDKENIPASSKSKEEPELRQRKTKGDSQQTAKAD